jgi:eukaryotic-like serine/threonine-protein kinase
LIILAAVGSSRRFKPLPDDLTTLQAPLPPRDEAVTQSLGAANDPALPRASSRDEPPLPSAIGHYSILRLLGEGGMGAVYEAEQNHPRRSVALKVIRAAWASPELLRRFEQEAQALGRLHHPGIAQIYEAGSADAGFGVQPFFAMELIHGEPLVRYADEHKLNTRQRLELMIQVCDAVQHAHQRGIIHRDLKPGNILVDESGQPKILDFGLARATDSDAQATRQTDIGQLLGTLAYMSPEQVLADPLALDTRSDVYALGVILYELLAGKLPYTLSRQLHEAVRTIQETDGAPLSTINRTYRGDIETIVAKALEKDKNRRYGSAAALAGDIRRYLDDQPITAKPASASYQLQKFARRHKGIVIGVAAVFAVLVLGVVASTWQAVKARRAQQEAERQSAIAQAVNDFLQKDLLRQANVYNQTKPDPDITVRTALDRAAQNIEGKFKNEPDVEIAIRMTIGDTYMGLGLYPEARAQEERALELSRRVYGDSDAQTLRAMSGLGSLDESQSRYPEGESLLVKAVEGLKRALGPENPDTLRTTDLLGIVYFHEGKYAQAESLYGRLMPTERRALGPEKDETLKAMSNEALVYYAEGKYPQAETLQTQALDIDRRLKGPEHPYTLITMNNLANTYHSESKCAQAEALHKEAWEIERRVLGPEHLDTIRGMGNVANDEDCEGRYPQAEDMFGKVLVLRQRVLGPDHQSTLLTMQELARVYNEEGKYAQAEAIEKQALEARRRTLGPEHPETLYSLTTLGDIYLAADQYSEAERAHRQALEIQQRVLGPENTDTLSTMGRVGEDLVAEGKSSQAEALHSRVLQIYKRLLGPEDPQTLGSMDDLAADYRSEGRYAESESLNRQGFEGYKRVLGPENPTTLYTLDAVGQDQGMEGKFTDAERNLSQAVDGYRRALGRTNPLTIASETHLAMAYQFQRKFAQAEALLKEAGAAAGSSQDPDGLGQLALAYAFAPDQRFRHPAEALRFARQSVKMAPENTNLVQILGLAQVRNGQWDQAVATLNKCIAMRNEPNPADYFVLALADEGRGDKADAQLNLARGVTLARKRPGVSMDARFLAAEAASALGKPAPLPIPKAN